MEIKITKKSYKFGTYATTEYRVNGELIKEISEEKRNCGTSWFNDLPSEEESEEVEIGRSGYTTRGIQRIRNKRCFMHYHN